MRTPHTTSSSAPPTHESMGPLRFSKSPGMGNSLFAMLAGAALSVWGLNFLYKPGFVSSTRGYNYWLYDFPLGLVLLGAGAAVVWLGWTLMRLKTEIFQHGLVQRSVKGEVRILFRELKTFAYATAAFRGDVFLNIHAMTFVDERGRTVAFQVQPGLGWDKDLPLLRDELSDLLAQKLEARLDSGVAWIPGVVIHRDGLAFPGTGQPRMGFSKDLPLSFHQGVCSLKTSTKTYEGSTGLPNFYPGLRLIERGAARLARAQSLA